MREKKKAISNLELKLNCLKSNLITILKFQILNRIIKVDCKLYLLIYYQKLNLKTLFSNPISKCKQKTKTKFDLTDFKYLS